MYGVLVSVPVRGEAGQHHERARQFATDRFACPRLLARLVNNPRSFWLVYVAVAAFLAAMIAVTGAFSPGPGPIRYAGMLPDSAVIPVFSLLTVLPLVAMAVGASRAWRAWHDGSLFATKPRILGRARANGGG